MSRKNEDKKKEYPYHRRCVRHLVRRQVKVKAGESDDTWTENISRGGLCFNIPRQIDEGDEVDLNIRLRTKPGGEVKCKCKVVWNDEEGVNHRHGCQFTTFEGEGMQHLKDYLEKF